MPVLNFAQDRFDIFDYRARAQTRIENGNHGGREPVSKISPRSRRIREISVEGDFVFVHLTSRLPVGQLLLCL